MTGLAFRVYGVAQPKGSMRAFVPRGMKHPIVTDSNRNAKSWAQLVAQGASDALVARGRASRLLAGSVHARIVFVLPRPKALSSARHLDAPHLKAPDLDKLIRSVLDALTSVIWIDDGQVTEVHAAKRYAQPLEVPHVSIAVEEYATVRQLTLFELDIAS